MENASKALIIAGSILLSILIIALGMYIFSTSSSTTDVTVLNETEIQTFNAKFEKYNKEQLGSNVEALIKAVRSNATANKGTREKIPTVGYYGTNTNNANTTPQAITLAATSATSGQNATNGQGNIIAGRTNAAMTDANLTLYNQALTAITNVLEKSHRYTVAMGYDSTGLIDRIIIGYNKVRLNN